jgi:thiol:disulfide interchange protein
MNRLTTRCVRTLAALALAAGTMSPGCKPREAADAPATTDVAGNGAAQHDTDTKGVRWRKISFDEALEEARAQKKLVFIDFWTSWCGWCKELDKRTFSDPEVSAAMNDRYVSLSIDAESKTGRPLAQRYGVRGYPHLVVVHPDGKVKRHISGFHPPESFLPQIVNDPVP